MDDLESQYKKETGVNAICILDYNTMCHTREYVAWLENKVLAFENALEGERLTIIRNDL
jgi:hypothetical protein